MRCHEAEELLAPQLSDYLDAATQRELALHLDGCATCRARLQQEYELDRMVIAAVNRETPTADALAMRIEQGLDKRRLRPFFLQWRWPALAGAAAVLLLCAFALTRFTTGNSMHLLCQDAVDDHHTEVVLREPRRWQTSSGEIAALARRTVALDQVPQSLDGLPLQQARICGLLQARALHLVYGKGPQQVSVFVMLRQELPPDSLPAATALANRLHQETDSGMSVTSFAEKGLGVVVVGDPALSRDVADQLVRSL